MHFIIFDTGLYTQHVHADLVTIHVHIKIVRLHISTLVQNNIVVILYIISYDDNPAGTHNIEVHLM